jgi:threonine dehydratase
MLTLHLTDFVAARARIADHIHHTPLLGSRQLSEKTGYDVRLKAELFQRGGSYKIRGPLNKFTFLTDDEKRRGVVCSSAGNHAQGVALAARLHGIRAVVCMAENATPAKIDATKAYGAEVVLHGTIWDEAVQRAGDRARAVPDRRTRRAAERRADLATSIPKHAHDISTMTTMTR